MLATDRACSRLSAVSYDVTSRRVLGRARATSQKDAAGNGTRASAFREKSIDRAAARCKCAPNSTHRKSTHCSLARSDARRAVTLSSRSACRIPARSLESDVVRTPINFSRSFFLRTCEARSRISLVCARAISLTRALRKNTWQIQISSLQYFIIADDELFSFRDDGSLRTARLLARIAANAIIADFGVRDPPIIR